MRIWHFKLRNIRRYATYLGHCHAEVSQDTALHKQLKVIQPSQSTHCSSIPYVLNPWIFIFHLYRFIF